MKKRFLSLILCIAMLFSTEVAGFVALAIDSLPDIPVKPDVWVTLDGEIVDDISIEQNQKVELLANISGIEAPKYQWQILMDAKMGIWVDIYDKTTQKCEVSYALLKGMLDGASVAYLRCAAFGSDGMKYYSDAIAVTVFVANPDLGIETLPPEESLSEEDLIKYYIENGMFSLLADDGSEYCTITIKYLDIKSLESGIETAIYSPYIAKVEKGTPFNQNVISPTFLGFAPYFDTDGNGKIEPDAGDADGSFVIFNETAVNEDIVINLYYKPINVPFAAKYFFQNINDDLYTENVSLYQISNAETGTIIQDELLKSWAGYPEGFEMMYHIPEAVAADGSTVFECYYDRLYYLLQFDNNGGYGVDPIYARYGTPFIVNDPIRYGYAFGGWDLLYDTDNDGVPDKGDGIADPLPATIQATPNGPDGKPEVTYYKAIWVAVETTYTVAYWAENAHGEYYFIGSKPVNSLSGVYVSGKDDLLDSNICGLVEHTHGPDCTCSVPLHTHDSTCCDIPEHTHTDECYSCIEHTHTSACCTIPYHKHGEEGCDCNIEEHIHSFASCGCSKQEHTTHNLKCYTNASLTSAESLGNSTERTIYRNYFRNMTSPENGHVYRYNYYNWRYYNYFYYNTTWYYLGYGNDYDDIKVTIDNPSNNSFEHAEAKMTCTEHVHDTGSCDYSCGKQAHTHGDGDCSCSKQQHDHTGNDCVCSEGKVAHTHGDGNCTYKCGKTGHTHGDGSCNIACGKAEHTHGATCVYDCIEHTHSDSCNEYKEDHYLEFVEAEQNVQVNGDGSTVVNVYYRHKEYTLRFYYARSGLENGQTTYRVVGGTTWYFGALANQKNNSVTTATDGEAIVPALLRIPDSWGKVAEEPEIKSSYIDDPDLISKFNLKADKTDSDFDSTYTYYYIEFTAQYGADISEVWPVDVFESVAVAEKHNSSGHYTNNGYCQYPNAYFSAWNGQYGVEYSHANENQTIKGIYQYLDESILFSKTVNGGAFATDTTVSYLCFWENGHDTGWSIPKIFEYRLYLQSLTNPSEYELYKTFRVYDDSDISGQTPIKLEGFATPTVTGDAYFSTDSETGLQKKVITMKYDRLNSQSLIFDNHRVTELTVPSVPFGTPLSEYKDFVPSYPQKLEENAYEFAGWYTTAGCLPGSEFDFENETMPPNDLVLYAKWAPTTHNVKFFLTLDDMNAYLDGDTSEGPLYSYENITHGNIVGSVTTPTRTGDGDQPLTFAGWFYIENGQKKAFSPLNMPINSDMTIYADWGSHTPVPYRIQYVLMSDKSVHVAPDSYGHAYAGSTRTFQAKAGPPLNQLYPEYASGYFPTVASHSITMQYESDSMNPEKNVYTFFYVQASEISYTINYVNKENNVVMKSVVKKTNASVVTERFEAFDNMVPDAFYKRLVISVVWDEKSGQYVGLPEDNVINFYYTPNDTTTFYAVKFMLETLEAGVYEESTTHIEGVADIGSIIPITPQEFPGFKLNEGKTQSENGDVIEEFSDGKYHIEATKEGTELIIYYDRLSVNYTVHYYKYNTTESLLDSKSGRAKYGATITENALSKPGWTCVSATTQSKQISNDASQNVIIFYYAEVQYVVEYIPVQSGMGWLSSTKEVVMGDDKFKGSIARSNEYYSFEGWFMDEACTIPVTPDKATLTSDGDDVNNVLVPVRAGLSETEANKFYAKFSPKAADLTINVKNAADNSQVFVFMIENNATGDTLVVTIVGNGTVTISGLTLAEYTVYQLSEEWSWRYVEYNNVIAHASAGGTVVNVGEQLKSNQQWLNGNSNLLPNKKGE